MLKVLTESPENPFRLYQDTINKFNQSSLRDKALLLSYLCNFAGSSLILDTPEELESQIRSCFPSETYEFALDLVGLYLMGYRFSQ